MGDWGSDNAASKELAIEAFRRLDALDSNHELLYFLKPPEGALEDDEATMRAVQDEMNDRFWRRSGDWRQEFGVRVGTIVWANYFIALKRAADAIEGHGGEIAFGPASWECESALEPAPR